MSVSPPSDEDTIPLQDYLAVPWRHRALVALVTAAITALGVVVNTLLPPVFESESVIRLRPIELSRDGAILVFDASPLARAIPTPSFVDGTARAAGIAATGGSLARGVRVGMMRDTRMVWLRVRHADRTVAQALNAALAQAFTVRVAVEIGPMREAITSRLRGVQAQRGDAEQVVRQSRLLLREPSRGGAADAGTRSLALSAMSTSLDTLQRLADERRNLEKELLIYALPTVVSGPTLPEAPLGPSLGRSILLAGVLAMAVAVAAAFAVEYVRQKGAPAALAHDVAPPAPTGVRSGSR